jgi:hypothetical protein
MSTLAAVSLWWLLSHRVWIPVDMSCHVRHAAPIVSTGQRVPVACPPRALGQPRITPGSPRVFIPWTPPPRSAVPAR